MTLFLKINDFLKKSEVTLKLFKLLSLFNTEINSTVYLETIDDLIFKIQNNIEKYHLNQLETTYNVIDNDFVTLNDLINELKNLYYQVFPTEAIAFITSFNTSGELDVMITYLLKHPSIERKSLLINKLENIIYKFAIEPKRKIIEVLHKDSLDKEELERIIAKIKTIKKLNNNKELNLEYLEIAILYFDYEWGKNS